MDKTHPLSTGTFEFRFPNRHTMVLIYGLDENPALTDYHGVVLPGLQALAEEYPRVVQINHIYTQNTLVVTVHKSFLDTTPNGAIIDNFFK